jgi:hypothetical protein
MSMVLSLIKNIYSRELTLPTLNPDGYFFHGFSENLIGMSLPLRAAKHTIYHWN